jgi:hypothetical protein
MDESWNQRLAAVVKTWGAASAGSDRRYAAQRLSQLASYGYIERIEKIGQMLAINSPFFRLTEGRLGSMALIEGKKCIAEVTTATP